MSASAPLSILPFAESSDRELVERARAGDVDAFSAIYDRYASRVLEVARRRLESNADAQDLLHDVFLEAWQSLREYDPERASMLTWLSVRTRSRALDRLARSGRQQRQCEQARSAAHTEVPRAERVLMLQGALGELDEPARHALELKYVWGFTASEISARTSVPEGTVRSRLARGLSALEQLLAEPGVAHVRR